MVTVIIPTLGLSDIQHLSTTLNSLDNSNDVSKIVVIDNSGTSQFSKVQFSSDKLDLVSPGKNIFVNPAWNLGVEKCDTKYFLILNDDILLNTSIIEKCLRVFSETSDTGVLTVKTITEASIDKFLEIMKIEDAKDLEYTCDIPGKRMGWFIFAKKENWVKIPSSLNIFFGDDFIYQMYEKKCLKNRYIVSGALISHIQGSTTLNEGFIPLKEPVKKADIEAWETVKKEYGLDSSPGEIQNKL